MYAIIETGGKQYRVRPGDLVDVERLDVAEGGKVEIDRVLFIAGDGKTTEGRPVIEGARVLATSKGEGRGDKVYAFRYKAKTRSQKLNGHRQLFTRLAIEEILGPGEAPRPAGGQAEAGQPETGVTDNGA
ncbi:MAG: 50S ribosomal protein L21 [Chloroflexi bacterium]|nr:50S ribosomal protein L21 [Chloroflexota bacterium]